MRIVAATNRSLATLVEQRLFRADLFYRLERRRRSRADAARAAAPTSWSSRSYFLERHRAHAPLRLSTAAADALTAYDWPGNVRELERLIERAVALAESDVLELDDLPPAVRGDYAAAGAVAAAQRHAARWASRYARLVLDRCDGNKREACRVLDISYHTLQAYLRLSAADARARSGVGVTEAAPSAACESMPAVSRNSSALLMHDVAS